MRSLNSWLVTVPRAVSRVGCMSAFQCCAQVSWSGVPDLCVRGYLYSSVACRSVEIAGGIRVWRGTPGTVRIAEALCCSCFTVAGAVVLCATWSLYALLGGAWAVGTFGGWFNSCSDPFSVDLLVSQGVFCDMLHDITHLFFLHCRSKLNYCIFVTHFRYCWLVSASVLT